MRVIIILLFLGFFSAPSFAQKKKSNKRPGLLGRAYHDITARNNAYFNGNEKMKAIQQTMRDGHKDDFTQIIPIYIDRNPEEAKGASADLDEIIKKGSKVVMKHEPARWADDGYLIIGKSYFLKSDFDNSIKAFQYVITKYKKKKKKDSGSKGKPQAGNSSSASKGSSSSSNSKSKKPMTAYQMKQAAIEAEQKQAEEETQEKIEQAEKEAETGFDGELYFKEPFKMKFRHKPAIDNAYIWIADNYSYMGKHKEAEAVFTLIESRGKFPFRLSDELETAKANLYYLKKDYAKTLEQLTTLTAKIKKNKKKNRYNFIMAQIHEQNKSYSDAITHYKKSLKGRPKYDIEFAALMSIARIGSLDNSIPSKKLKSMLSKMAKDVKNKDYLDQIYYYLAELCLREGDKKCAITNLKKSIENSTSNNKQKAVAHLKLADLYFNDEQYREAQENYAAAVALLDAKYPGYADIKYRSEVLAELVKQLDIIYEQDSLLKIARLPEKELNKFLDDIIFKKEQEEKAKKENTEQLAATPAQKASSTQEDAGQGSKSDWYFYNPSLKATGYNEFIKNWGNRKLEDNWRRSNKSKEGFENSDAAKDTSSADTETASASLDREQLLKNFPMSKEAQSKSDEMILTALYEAATIYKSKLSNLPKAIANFEDILKRYPENKYQAQIYYNLYLLYKDEANMAKSDYYKNLLLNNFADSPYAKIILDPDYLAKKNQKNKSVEEFYKATYAYYQNGAYDTVINLIALADSLYKDNVFQPKFDLLEAFAVGKTKDLKSYKEALKTITEKYKGNEVNAKAKEILDYLENSDTKEVRIQNNVADFDYKPDDGHYFMLVFNNDSINATDVNNSIAQWNDVNRSLESLKINSLIIKDNLTLVAVKTFKNLKTAKDYLAAITASTAMTKFALPKIFTSIISENNFNLIVRNREIDSYKVFYNSRYSQ